MPTITQRRRWALILITISCCCCLTTPSEARSRDKDNRRRNDRMQTASSTSSSSYYNTYGSSSSGYGQPAVENAGFCTRRRDMKLMCYCTPDENHAPILKAECWVFSDSLYQNDTTWSRFQQQKRLRDLKFVIQNRGRLDYIPTMILEPLKNLTSINIEFGQIEIIKSYAFANLPNLERIILVSNQLSVLDQDAFANHLRLRELNLEFNQIYEIDRYAFRNLPQCEELFLNNNNITSLHDSLFVEMVRLKYLNLAFNQISVLTSDIFKGLGYLSVLKLTHNNLNFIGDTVFAELWSLVELELDDNRIERISERALDGLNNLKTLNLRNNLLKKIDNGVLRGTPALLSINLQSNELETLTFYTFQPIMDNLVNSTSELSLTNNDFICDCRMQWIFDLRNRTQHMQLRDTLDDIICTLQEPKLSNFIEPIPGHILSLLNVGGYMNGNGKPENRNGGEIRAGGRKRTSKARQSTATRRQNVDAGLVSSSSSSLSSLSSSSGAMAMVDAVAVAPAAAAVAAVAGSAPGTAAMRKRSLPQQTQTLAGGVTGYETKPSDYYEDARGMQTAQQLDAEDELDMMKQNALFAQHNDVLAVNQLGIGGGGGSDANKPTLGIKVRLFMLRPENLPCQVALSDPTELPVSRDLVDSRSNLPNNALSQATGHSHRWSRTIVVSVLVAVVARHIGVGIRLRAG